MTDEKIFLELLKSLENDKKLFLSGILHTEIEFLNNIYKLQRYIPIIQDSEIKEKINTFVNSVINSKNYSIILRSIEEEKIRKEKQKIARQKQEEKKRKVYKNNKNFIEEDKLKKESISNVILNINEAISKKDLKNALNLYQNNYIGICDYFTDYYLTISPKMEIIKIILKRKIEKLVHFTNIKNLESILNLGILPRNVLDENNIIYKYTDTQRFDGRPDCICLSLEYPNFKMLHYKKYNSEDVYVMIVIDAKSILINDLKKYYVYINAANSNATYQLTKDKLTTPRYFENMFLPNVSDTKGTYERDETDPPFIPTNPQAEILISGNINVEDILEIHFSNKEDFDLFKHNCTNKQILNKYKFIISDFYFKEDRKQAQWEDR